MNSTDRPPYWPHRNSEVAAVAAIFEAEEAERDAAKAADAAVKRETEDAVVAPALRRIAKLERQVASLVAMFSDEDSDLSKTFKLLIDNVAELKRSALRYKGVWGGMSAEYKKRDSVTANSALWVATRDNPGRPGDGDSGWQLAVKSGAAS
jgi:hypothetical protein